VDVVLRTEKSSLNWQDVHVDSPGIFFSGSMVTLKEFYNRLDDV
jgi:hypothetical protein